MAEQKRKGVENLFRNKLFKKKLFKENIVIQGCKYFTMFGILLCVMCVIMQKIFISLNASEKTLYILHKIFLYRENQIVNQNQMYQKQ